jgi:hypothetical protein
MSASFLLRSARDALSQGEPACAELLVSEVVVRLETATSSKERADTAHLLSSRCRKVALPDDCERYARMAVAEERVAGRVVLLGNHLMFLADFLCEHGRYQEALPLAKEGFACHRTVYGDAHSETRYMASVVAAIEMGDWHFCRCC